MSIKKKLFILCKEILNDLIRVNPSLARPHNELLKTLWAVDKAKKEIKEKLC